MSIRIYDSRTQTVRDFVPRVAGQVGMYICGPTVQSPPHVGHLRSALVYDLWRRWFQYRNYRVTLIRNVTDIDDKILANASETEPWWALAYRVELDFSAGASALGILPPSYEPRATANVTQMQELIANLIERGHAYPAEDGSGDVYFAVASWSAYGELTRQNPNAMAASSEEINPAKRGQHDFALWKGHKANEPLSASWESPWGRGRPGWHIECSAMARRYLGEEFDIHGGGLDLRFPHHENELAQSTAAGHQFARYWVHNGIVTVEGQKMSKSLGNSIYAAEFLSLAPPLVVRYYLASAHYRSTIDYHPGALSEAESALERITGFLTRAGELNIPPHTATIPDAFAWALDDDLNTPQAFSVLHETVRAGNTALNKGDTAQVAELSAQLRAMLGVLGINPGAKELTQKNDGAKRALGVLVQKLLDTRNLARTTRDFATADRIRDDLAKAGIVLEDTSTGARWHLDSKEGG